jgi:hypothetical protein
MPADCFWFEIRFPPLFQIVFLQTLEQASEDFRQVGKLPAITWTMRKKGLAG